MLGKKIFLIFLILNLLTNNKIYSLDWLITNSGNYILGDDILAAGDATNGSIRIQSSYVNLDLNGRFISQQDATAGAIGIQIDPGSTYVTIKNGTIRNFTGKGIVAGGNVRTLMLQNLNIESCQTRGIDFSGTSASTITESTILNCKIINCLSGSSADYGLNLTNCSRILVADTVFSGNGGSAAPGDISIVGVTDSNTCTFRNLDINSNFNNTASGGINGILLNSVSSTLYKCNIINSIFRNNSCVGGNCLGVNILGVNSSYNVIDNFLALGNSNLGFLAGVYLSSSGTISANVFRNCIVSGNSSTGLTIGFYLVTVSLNFFIDCIALKNSCSNTATGSNCAGYRLNSSNSNVFLRGIVSSNSAPSGTATCEGVLVGAGGTTANFNEFKDCDVLNNIGSTNANSYGFHLAGIGASNLYTRNIAFNNGPVPGVTLANQTNGIAAGSVSASTTTISLNTPTAPWTNFGLVS